MAGLFQGIRAHGSQLCAHVNRDHVEGSVLGGGSLPFRCQCRDQSSVECVGPLSTGMTVGGPEDDLFGLQRRHQALMTNKTAASAYKDVYASRLPFNEGLRLQIKIISSVRTEELIDMNRATPSNTNLLMSSPRTDARVLQLKDHVSH